MMFNVGNVHRYNIGIARDNAANLIVKLNQKCTITTALVDTPIELLNQCGTVHGANVAACSPVSSTYGTVLVELHNQCIT